MKITKSIAGLLLAAIATTGLMATPAEARHRDNYQYQRGDYYGGNYARSGYNNYNGYNNYDRYDRYDRQYDRRSRYRSQCSNGTGGTIIGAVAGGLLGDRIAGRGSRTEGTIIGAAVGALGGRAIDKGTSRCR